VLLGKIQPDMISLARLPETKMTMRAALLREKNSKGLFGNKNVSTFSF